MASAVPLPPLTLPPAALESNELTMDVDSIILDVNNNNNIYTQDEEDDDIYRGPPPASPITHLTVQPTSTRTSSPSPSTSSSSSAGWRGGPLATRIEQAITRWARRRSSGSSTSSDGTDSTRTRSRLHSTTRRRYAPGSKRHKHRHERRIDSVIPREFVLFLPPQLSPAPLHRDSVSKLDSVQAQQQRILRTPSLPLVLAQLETALKKRSKIKRIDRKAHHASHTRLRQEVGLNVANGSRETSGTTTPTQPIAKVSDLLSVTRAIRNPTSGEGLTVGLGHAWWLDVSSPSWDDMKHIGKLLHLHPLTLEDILQQDPREKLEVFSRLGYYFIVIGALAPHDGRDEEHNSPSESEKVSLDSIGDLTEFDDDPADPGAAASGMVQAVNLYLVVFEEGIISFHFGDVSEHIDRVRDRILLLENSTRMSADWIAHGLIDSVVDGFFPIVSMIENEVKALDGLGHGIGNTAKSELFKMSTVVVDVPTPSKGEKQPPEKIRPRLLQIRRTLTESVQGGSSVGRFNQHASRTRLGQMVCRVWKPRPSDQTTVDSMGSLSTLLRMSSTRRLVTGIGRLLAAKIDVVGQIQKRLLTPVKGRRQLGYGSEISIHMGDVYDHLLSINLTLDHCDRVLSHSQPAYLSYLRVRLGEARGGVDKILFGLTVVIVGVSLMQMPIGVFSMNVRVPRNGSRQDPTLPAKLIVFPLIILVDVLLGCGLAVVLRYWFKSSTSQSRRRRFSV